MKRYDPASEDVLRKIASLREAHYATELKDVTIGALFVYDDESGKPVLKHNGYPAAAKIRVVGLRDRADGLCDAQMIIDRVVYAALSGKSQLALIDHELYHLERHRDKHGVPLFDALDRPKLKVRKHDWQLGWFDAIANRHGEHSIEILEARRLLSQSGQLYFDFEQLAA